VSTNGQSYRLVDDEYDEHVHCDIAVIWLCLQEIYF
jgi:hypothetical protein